MSKSFNALQRFQFLIQLLESQTKYQVNNQITEGK